MHREFRDLKTLAQAKQILWQALPERMREGRFGLHQAPVAEAVGCILDQAVVSAVDLPAFDRSTVDGYAVRARDTFGASEGLPAYLNVTGEVRMGEPADLSISYQQCAGIPTGGMLPGGADAVVMVEHTQPWGEDSVEVRRPAAPGENVVHRGDDVKQGEALLAGGHRLRPQDISALAGLGIAAVVVRRPRVAVLSTGCELVPYTAPLSPGKIHDMNGPALCAAVRALGGEPLDLGLVSDDQAELQHAVLKGVAEADLVLVSGGTSVGAEDLIPEVLASLGPPGLIIHGLAVRPGKPVAVAMAGEVPVFGLPGHPTSALVMFRELVGPLIALATGAEACPPAAWLARPPTVTARLARNVPSQAGREDLVRVTVEQRDGEWHATPLLAPSALISSLVRAHGLVRVPAEAEGLCAGDCVEVELWT
jgi:molybdopterin molybdotransferase